MYRPLPLNLWCAILLCVAPAAYAQEPLTAEHVLRLACEAPEVRQAETRVSESLGRLTDAKVWSTRNPALSIDTGPRISDRTTVDAGLSLDIPVELWGQRGRRVDTAQAEIARKQHAAADVRRKVAGAALDAFYRVLHARDVVHASNKQAALSVELLRVAQERYQEGDIPLLHVNLTRAELARAESKVHSAEQRYAEARTVLARRLGRSDTLDFQIKGDLSDRSLFDVAHKEKPGVNRADLSEAKAGIKQVQAQLALAELERLPETSFSLGYKREEDADIVFAGFSVSLPVFNRGQGLRETLAAQLRSARIEEKAVRSVIESQIRGARLAYQSAVEAARGMESEGVPLQIENSQLALEAYGAGKIDLASLLLIRRESLDFQREARDRQLAASLAGVKLALASGSLPIFELKVPTEGDSTLLGD